MGTRTTIARAVTLVALAGLTAAACTTGDPAVPSTAGQEDARWPEELTVELDLSDHPDTVLYLLAGPADRSSTVPLLEVYRFDAGQPTARRLTHSTVGTGVGVSWLSAATDVVALADAATGRDEIVFLVGEQRLPLAGEPPGTRAFAPTVHPDGRVLYTRLNGSDDPLRPVSDLVVRDHPGAQTQVPYTVPARAIGVWGPDDTIVVLVTPHRDRPRDPHEVRVVDPATGEARRLDTGPVDPTNLLGHPEARYVVANDARSGRAVLVNVRHGTVAPLPHGWLGLCFDPTGTRLLVGDGGELALVSPEAPDRLQPVGRVPGMVVERCAWVEGGGR